MLGAGASGGWAWCCEGARKRGPGKAREPWPREAWEHELRGGAGAWRHACIGRAGAAHAPWVGACWGNAQSCVGVQCGSA